MEKMLDLIIIGSGPIGLACGVEASRKSLNYKILEKGCLVNSIYRYPVNMTFFSTSDKIEIGDVPFVSHGTKPTRSEALEYYRRVKNHWGLDVHTYEPVQGMKKLVPKGYEVQTSKATYAAKAVIIATGFFDYPNLLGVPGEDLPKVKHFYDEPHPYLERKVVVVGAANSAVDVALETYRKGAEVTLVVRKPEISPKVKYWVRPDIVNRIKEGSIKAYFNSNLTTIREHEVDIETPDGQVTVANDFVLAMTGYHPNYKWLQQMGIQITDDDDRMPLRNPDTFETQLPNVYLAGTVCGGMKTSKWYIENSIAHAKIILEQVG